VQRGQRVGVACSSSSREITPFIDWSVNLIRKSILTAFIVALTSTALSLAQQDAGKGRCFAFLVACGDYDPTELKPVPFTLHEMKLFREVLIASGTTEKNIIYMHDKADQPGRFNPIRANILKEYKLLLERLRPEDSLVVALSGHGIQYRNDTSGYFCPLDAKLGPAHKKTLLAMEGEEGLLTLLEKTKAQRKLVIINACRNDPATNAFLAAEKLDLRDDYSEEAPKGTVVLFACSKGQRSYFYSDTEKRLERRNRSLFMYHLTEAWQGKYAQGKKVTLEHVLGEVRNRVEDDASTDFRNNQMPLAKKKFEGSWHLAARQVKVIESSIGMKLAYIPPGEFMMGSPKIEQDQAIKHGAARDYFRAESPQHKVKISKGFYLGVYTVTQVEYEKVMGNNPSWFSASGDGKKEVAGLDTRHFPVERVSWDEAKEFCKKLSAKEGKEYRLPTEAEWEYACRAETTTPFHFGESISTDQANYNGESVFGSGMKGENRKRTMKAGSFPANEWGLHDMHGNVFQWCEDLFDMDYYGDSPAMDPLNVTKGTSRVFRGGCWVNHARSCRSAFRDSRAPGFRNGVLGFRVVHSSAE
jgi:formylglycine-generating enzyme required for sulfatase activity